MTEAELKKIHGKDVELAPDDSEDEKLTEKQALAQAKKEGIEFVDEWVVVDETTEISVHETLKEAEKALKKGQAVMQRRTRKWGAE